jgi:hypothetical protein
MVQVKTQENKRDNVNDGIYFIGKKIYGHAVKIVIIRNPDYSLRRVRPTQLYKIEPHQMYKQEDANDYACMNHEFREK